MTTYTQEEIIKANADIFNRLIERKSLLEYLFSGEKPKRIQDELASIEIELTTLYTPMQNQNQVKGEQTGVITQKYSNVMTIDEGKEYTPDDEINFLNQIAKENDELIKSSGLEDKKQSFTFNFENVDKVFEEYKEAINKAETIEQLHEADRKYRIKYFKGCKFEDIVSNQNEYKKIDKLRSTVSEKLYAQTLEKESQVGQKIENVDSPLVSNEDKFKQAKEKYDNSNLFKKIYFKITGKAKLVDGQYIVEEDSTNGMSK